MKKVFSVFLCVILLFATAGVAAAEGRTRLLVLGDSIAYGSGLSNPTQAVYGRVVADTEDWDYENYAVPGYTTAALLRLMETDAVKEAIGAADVISISIGGNNFLLDDLNAILFDGIVKEDYARINAIADAFYTDLCTVVANIRALNADAAILLQTLYNPQTGYVGEVYQKGADSLNGKVRLYAQEHPGEVIVVDVAAALTDSGTDFAEDRIHPSAAGNEKIARAVVTALYENGLGTAAEPVFNTEGRDLRGTGMFTFFVDLWGSFFHVLAVVRSLFTSLLPA